MFFERVILASSSVSIQPPKFFIGSRPLTIEARVNELSLTKAVKEDTIRYEDLVKQLKLDYKVNKSAASIHSVFTSNISINIQSFKSNRIRTSNVLEYVAKWQEEGAAIAALTESYRIEESIFTRPNGRRYSLPASYPAAG